MMHSPVCSLSRSRQSLKVKMILPALNEALNPFFRPIKYSLFPPLGLASLAAYLSPDDEVTIQDEHVEVLALDDEPDIVVIQSYITSARRSYELADHYRSRGSYVCIGGLHATSLPHEAAPHADSIFLGPGEDPPGGHPGPSSCSTFGRAIPRRATSPSRARCSARRRSGAT